jgi:hypothetical protein
MVFSVLPTGKYRYSTEILDHVTLQFIFTIKPTFNVLQSDLHTGSQNKTKMTVHFVSHILTTQEVIRTGCFLHDYSE